MTENPYRTLNPKAFDQGEKINQRSEELLKAASQDMSKGDAVTALTTSLGAMIANMVRDQPNLSIHTMLKLTSQHICEKAYEDLQTDIGVDVADLTEEEFNTVTSNILKTAATHILPNDAISALCKALGVLIYFTANKQKCSIDTLLKVGNESIAEFANSAQEFIASNNI